MRTRVLAVAALAALSSSPAAAGKKAGVTMPGSVNVGGKKLVLNGMGIRQATVFNINVYVAGLFLEKMSSDPASIIKSEQNKHLVLHFVRDVDRDDLVDAFEDGFENNGPSSLEPRVKKLIGWMSDVEVGDRIELTYVPKKGTTVSVGGKKKGSVDGADFAGTLLKIFVGPEPPNTSLKTGLLGKS
ncbi:chalcone isomerase family protein [Myxococcota bacterium]